MISYELFTKAFDHISECIDTVYKDLTKGKAAPMGGVAYLSLEDSDVRRLTVCGVETGTHHLVVGTLSWRY